MKLGKPQHEAWVGDNHNHREISSSKWTHATKQSGKRKQNNVSSYNNPSELLKNDKVIMLTDLQTHTVPENPENWRGGKVGGQKQLEWDLRC